MGDHFFVYILANLRVPQPVLYTGVTNDLYRRVAEHRNRPAGFVARYKLDALVYFETTGDVRGAIAREKRIKGWIRARKVELIETMNPDWRDLLPEGSSGARGDSSLRSE